MRKIVIAIVSVCLVVMLVASLAACGETPDIQGNYTMVSFTKDGQECIDQIPSDNMPTLKINGSEAVTTLDGNTYMNFTIDENAKTMTANGQSLSYSVSGSKITLDTHDGRKQVFEKDQ